MRSQAKFAILALTCGLLLTLLASCGSSGSSDRVNLHSISVRSPALGSGIRIPPRYKCRDEELRKSAIDQEFGGGVIGRATEASIWVPLTWDEVPDGTEEIAIAISVSRLTRTGDAQVSALAGQWFIGSLDPHRRHLNTGPLPPGALFGVHSPGTGSFCPSKNQEIGLVFSVYAMPDIDFGDELRKGRLEAGGVETVKALEDNALAAGLLSAVYRKG